MSLRIVAQSLLVSVVLASDAASTNRIPKVARRVTFNLPPYAEDVDTVEEDLYPQTPVSPRFARRPLEYDDIEYPRTPFHQMYPRHDEDVDALAARSAGGASASAVEVVSELGCVIFDSLKEYVAEQRRVVVEGAKNRLRSAARGAAVYSVQTLFGYTVTADDEAKITGILSQPQLLSHIIDHLHAVCVTTTAAPIVEESFSDEVTTEEQATTSAPMVEELATVTTMA